MTYIILTHHDQSKLAQEVTRRLSLGWQLVGGVSVATSVSPGGTHYIYYTQAMQSDMS